MKNLNRKVKGFTIIEVVLVLAIAGLIFLMVFIALPALQRGQRDAQRKNDLSRVMTKINDYSTNNRGAIPASLITTYGSPPRSFVYNYLGNNSNNVAGTDFQDPQVGTYTFAIANSTPPTTPSLGNIYYDTASKCGTDGAVVTGSTRQYTLRTFLEGQSTLYCIDNR